MTDTTADRSFLLKFTKATTSQQPRHADRSHRHGIVSLYNLVANPREEEQRHPSASFELRCASAATSSCSPALVRPLRQRGHAGPPLTRCCRDHRSTADLPDTSPYHSSALRSTPAGTIVAASASQPRSSLRSTSSTAHSSTCPSHADQSSTTERTTIPGLVRALADHHHHPELPHISPDGVTRRQAPHLHRAHTAAADQTTATGATWAPTKTAAGGAAGPARSRRAHTAARARAAGGRAPRPAPPHPTARHRHRQLHSFGGPRTATSPTRPPRRKARLPGPASSMPGRPNRHVWIGFASSSGRCFHAVQPRSG